MSGSSPTLNEAYFFVGFNFQRPSGGFLATEKPPEGGTQNFKFTFLDNLSDKFELK
jgi:hypothetical protein